MQRAPSRWPSAVTAVQAGTSTTAAAPQITADLWLTVPTPTPSSGRARLQVCFAPRTRAASQPSRDSRQVQLLRATSVTTLSSTGVLQVLSTYRPTPERHSARLGPWAAQHQLSTLRRTRPLQGPCMCLRILESSSPPTTVPPSPRYRPLSQQPRRSLSDSAREQPGTSTPSATAQQETGCTRRRTTARHGPTSKDPRASDRSAAASSQAARTRPGRSTWAPTAAASSMPRGR